MAIIKAALKRERKNGKCTRWRVIVYNRHTHKQEWFTVEGTMREAEAFERQQKDKLRAGTYIAKLDRKTFKEVADAFLAQLPNHKRRGSTIDNYTGVLNRYLLPEFGMREASLIHKPDVEAFLQRLVKEDKSAQLVARVLRTLKVVVNYGLSKDMIEADRLVKYSFRGGRDGRRRNQEAFTEDEVRSLLQHAKVGPCRTLILLRVMTGLRINEAFALQWGDVDLVAGTLEVRRTWDAQARNADGSRGAFAEPKTTASRRSKALDAELVDALTELRAKAKDASDDALIFANRDGGPLSYHNFNKRVWEPLRAQANVRALTFYSLRHTYGTMLLNNGMQLAMVSRAMGHEQETTTLKHYVSVLPSSERDAAASVSRRLFGEPSLRVIEGGKSQAVSEALDGTKEGPRAAAANR